MRSKILCALALALVAAPAAAKEPKFSEWDGPSTRVGQGGTKISVDGVDLWTVGDPPREYRVLGVLTREHGGDGTGKVSRLAELIRQHGGQAGIIMDESTANRGAVAISPTMMAAVKRTTVRVLVIAYTQASSDQPTQR